MLSRTDAWQHSSYSTCLFKFSHCNEQAKFRDYKTRCTQIPVWETKTSLILKAPEYIVWPCFQTVLPFPEGNDAKKFDFSSICTILRVIAIFRI